MVEQEKEVIMSRARIEDREEVLRYSHQLQEPGAGF